MDKLKCLEAFMRIIELGRTLIELAWKRMAPAAIRSYAEEIILQCNIIEEEVNRRDISKN